MVKEITVDNLKIDIDNKLIFVIDVRENHELQICKIEPCLHIPLQELQSRINLLNMSNKYAVICHSGYRSKTACNLLNYYGYDVVNVIGGINEWAIKVDQDMNRY